MCVGVYVTGSLHLAYYATEITLHRRIVHSLDPSTTDPYLIYICRSAAKTRLISAMDFVNRLKTEQLQSWWYSTSKTNFALIGTFGSLLLATSPSEQEAEFYRLRLSEYRWTLTVNAKWARFVRMALGTLEASMEMLQKMERRPSLTSSFRTFDLFMKEDQKPPPVGAAVEEQSVAFKPSVMDPPSGLASPSISTASTESRQLTPVYQEEMGSEDGYSWSGSRDVPLGG